MGAANNPEYFIDTKNNRAYAVILFTITMSSS